MAEPVLVTGATGFIGRHLVTALTAQGVEVRAHSQRVGDIAGAALECEKVSHVFHLAARTFVPDSWASPAEFYRTNVQGTVNVLEFCRRTGASLTFLSSYVYGRPLRLPIAEDHPLQPYNPYSHTKILAEEVVAFYVGTFGIQAAVIRPFNIYGPGQAATFLIPEIVRQVLDPSCDAVLVEDAEPRRDYLYIDDLVALLIASWRRNVAGVYNAGAGSSVSVEEIVREILLQAGVSRPLQSASRRRPNEVMDVVADIAASKREMMWAPQTSLAEGLRRTLLDAKASSAQ
jgi:nucleoside-diphosphate-sugar epimerase